MKQKTHLRSESSDSEGHFNLCYFLGICSMDNERLCMFCGSLQPFTSPWAMFLVSSTCGSKSGTQTTLICVSGLHMNAMARNYYMD